MLRRLRKFALIIIAAGAGVLIGRGAAKSRARSKAGEDPLKLDKEDLEISPQDMAPGVIAAFRVGEPPWSWLHIPGWLAAFGTNFAVTAVGGDLDRLREVAEEYGLSFLGFDTETDFDDIAETESNTAGEGTTRFETTENGSTNRSSSSAPIGD